MVFKGVIVSIEEYFCPVVVFSHSSVYSLTPPVISALYSAVVAPKHFNSVLGVGVNTISSLSGCIIS